MEQLKKKLNSALESVIEKSSILVVELEKVAKKKDTLNKKAKEQETKSLELDVREDAVSKVESVVAIEDSIKKITKENHVAKVNLSKDEKAFEAKKKVYGEDLTVRQEALDKEKARYGRENKALKEAKNKLDEKIKNVEKDMLKKLKK